jgi:hypothetical protein
MPPSLTGINCSSSLTYEGEIMKAGEAKDVRKYRPKWYLLKSVPGSGLWRGREDPLSSPFSAEAPPRPLILSSTSIPNQRALALSSVASLIKRNFSSGAGEK